MTVKELTDVLGLTVYSVTTETEIVGVYCCDLLSNALVKLKKDTAWLTVINNVNTAAVAYNNQAACVILTEGVTPDSKLLERATQYDIPILGCKQSTYEVAVLINDLLQ